jgi:hypothetical protein
MKTKISNLILSSALLSCLLPLPALAADKGSLDGTYEYPGNIRNATISKVTIKTVNSQPRVHVWFYGRPEDVDWGEVTASEYYNQSMPRWRDLVAEMQHGTTKAIIVLRVGGAVSRTDGSQTVHNITADAWIRYEHPDDRHPNDFAHDDLKAKN